MMIYNLLKPLLFSQNPETVHERLLSLGRRTSASPILMNAVRALFYLEDARLKTQAGGLWFPNPVGLAAGFDKNAEMIPLLEALGFGAVEVGTVTPKGQPGNPSPRLFRLLEDRAIINRMGFNNDGIDALLHRVQGLSRNIPLGINLGKNKSTPNEEALQDYRILLEKAYPEGDYFVINISSPNTPGLRGLQELEALRPLLEGLLNLRQKLSQGRPKPLWLKLAPDLDSEELEKICRLAVELQLNALVLTNTTLGRPRLKSPLAAEAGGLSGKPLRELSLQKLKEAYRTVGDQVDLIGVGGIFNGQDALDKLKAGAKLVQVYTGMIFEGPGLIKAIKQGLLHELGSQGCKSLDQLRQGALQGEKGTP